MFNAIYVQRISMRIRMTIIVHCYEILACTYIRQREVNSIHACGAALNKIALYARQVRVVFGHGFFPCLVLEYCDTRLTRFPSLNCWGASPQQF